MNIYIYIYIYVHADAASVLRKHLELTCKVTPGPWHAAWQPALWQHLAHLRRGSACRRRRVGPFRSGRGVLVKVPAPAQVTADRVVGMTWSRLAARGCRQPGGRAGAYTMSANKQLMSTSTSTSTMQTGSSTSIAADVRGELRTSNGVWTRMNPAIRGTRPAPTAMSSATGLIRGGEAEQHKIDELLIEVR